MPITCTPAPWKGSPIEERIGELAAVPSKLATKTLEALRDLSGYVPSPEQDRAADAELARRLGGAG